MTYDYKAALDGIDWKFNDGSFTKAEKNTIRHALTIAAEYEKVKRDLDDVRNFIGFKRDGREIMECLEEYSKGIDQNLWVKIEDHLSMVENLRKERDELAEVLDDILHSAFEHGCKNLSGKTLDPDGEMLWKAKQLVNKIRSKNDIRL